MKHLFTESAVWKTTSEFVSPEGTISHAKGESTISVGEAGITNKSWVELGETKRVNNYKITPVSSFELTFESLNPELGKQTGIFNIDRNTIFSKFRIEDTALNGYEIIRREEDTCHVQGALYDNNTLINTWSATMRKTSDK